MQTGRPQTDKGGCRTYYRQLGDNRDTVSSIGGATLAQ